MPYINPEEKRSLFYYSIGVKIEIQPDENVCEILRTFIRLEFSSKLIAIFRYRGQCIAHTMPVKF